MNLTASEIFILKILTQVKDFTLFKNQQLFSFSGLPPFWGFNGVSREARLQDQWETLLFYAMATVPLTDVSCGFHLFTRPPVWKYAVDFLPFSRFGNILLVVSPLSARLSLSGCFSLSSINTYIHRFNETCRSAPSTAFFPSAFLTAFFSPTVFFLFALFTFFHFQQPFSLTPFSPFLPFQQSLPKCPTTPYHYRTQPLPSTQQYVSSIAIRSASKPIALLRTVILNPTAEAFQNRNRTWQRIYHSLIPRRSMLFRLRTKEHFREESVFHSPCFASRNLKYIYVDIWNTSRFFHNQVCRNLK